MPPNRIMFIRHAEKPDNAHGGVKCDGSADEESLIVRGWQRAGALARFFYPASGASELTPHTIFASGIGHHSESERPMETVGPLVKLLKAENPPVEFNTTHLKNDIQGLMQDVSTKQGTVLVAWEHELIPSAVAQLPHAPAVPQTWPGDRFDIVWVFDQAGTGWTFSQIPQRLLAGDSASPIT
jgi:broad specificity phosphatase PhoE